MGSRRATGTLRSAPTTIGQGSVLNMTHARARLIRGTYRPGLQHLDVDVCHESVHAEVSRLHRLSCILSPAWSSAAHAQIYPQSSHSARTRQENARRPWFRDNARPTDTRQALASNRCAVSPFPSNMPLGYVTSDGDLSDSRDSGMSAPCSLALKFALSLGKFWPSCRPQSRQNTLYSPLHIYPTRLPIYA